MYETWITLRNELIFDATPCNFERRCTGVIARYLKKYKNESNKNQEEIAQLICDIATDLCSYLPTWTLKELDKNILEKYSNEFLTMVENWGFSKKVVLAKKEIASFEKSKLIKLSECADKGEIFNRWGNDNGIGIMEAMRRGAALVTTNPPIVNMARQARPDVFDKVRDEIVLAYSNEPVQKRISRLTLNVVLNNCRALRKIYLITNGKLGYVNYQVSPKNYKDTNKMVEEIEFAYEELSKALNGKPNVVFKVPGVHASVEAVKQVTAQGIGVNMTVNFGVAQCEIFADAIESGNADLSYLTLMAGRLDDPITEELETKGIVNAKEYGNLATRTVIAKVYKDILIKNNYKHTEILVASLRGAWNFDAAITTNPNSKIVISSFPDKAEDYDGKSLDINSIIDENISSEKMDVLRKSDIFKKAYDMGAMDSTQFDDYIPVVQTLTSFIEVYEQLEEYMR